ncbi:hypothetical protein NV226_02475 [Mycoplasma iguanae]|uniref:Helix-hairpin-helix domain-containing protein n=1 Tax=Mycoplasma iguanae TaxID=292461 RepID=A0ABY5R7Y5_9MOLU|nr:hypothetical protein [Mycoplasma iguanae]UVD81569.1 hypothetical protein NV226_02475 [Mycoplasma iguanae]
MKWKIFIISGFFLFVLVTSLTSFTLLLHPKIDQSQITYIWEFIGEVKRPIKLIVKKDTKLKEIILQINLLNSADISQLNLEQKAESDNTFFIGKKRKNNNSKINWKAINTLEDLKDIKISKALKEKILNLRKLKEKVNWNDILALPGIGKITLAKLKTFIVIDS